MAHPPPSRLAALPGYDTAPDIYETPDLADTTTTTTVGDNASSSRSPSPSEESHTSDTEDDDQDEQDNEDPTGGVSRRRINIGKARRRFDFQGRGVRTKGVDFGGRVDGGGRGYGLRATRAGNDEGLEERIARLRREVEECRVLAAQEDGEDGEGVEGLKVLVESLDMEMDGRRKGEKETKGLRREGSSGTPGAWPDGEMEMSEERLLGRVADFDSRLAGLEGALGLAAVDATGVEGATVMPLLPSLAVLDQQLSALSSASSTANLEAMASRIQRLRSEADNALTQPSPNETTEPDADGESTSLSPEDRESLTKLYTLLPTLHNLAPTVPALLTRLRSLRTLHTNAANAASALEDVEKRQAEMDRELSTWRQGLEKVEAAVARANEGNGRNGKFVEGWVRDLEKRMQTLPR